MTDLLPYFKERKISRLLTQLEDDVVILTGHFNKKGYDRTKWYSMPEFAVETPEKAKESLVVVAINLVVVLIKDLTKAGYEN